MRKVRVLTQEEIDIIKKLYTEGIAIHKIASILKTDKKKVSKAIKEMGFKVTNGKFVRKYKINHNVFNKIDTEQKAYMLGYLMADGSIGDYNNQKCLQLHLNSDDEYILEYFLNIMDSNYPIRTRLIQSFNTISKQSYFNITSEQIYNDLIALNMKSKDSIPNIPINFISHFIRGYFDGDGCFSISSRGDAEFYIMAEQNFLIQLCDIFKQNNITFKSIKHQKANMYKIRKSGKREIKKIYDFLYKDATIYLQRKHNKMEEYIYGE